MYHPMAEEFQESEVMFDQHYESGSEEDNELDPPETAMRNQKPRRKKLRSKRSASTRASSLPVNIPENSSWSQNADSDFTDDDDGSGDGEMEPPHLIIGRRIAGRMMAFSVCTGNGSTLKGRDLRNVRNSILRMTGFLET